MAHTRFTLRQLEIFAAVMKSGQVRRAADTLHLSQAAVSQALRELADALDVTLFTRTGRELQPTASARQLLALSEAAARAAVTAGAVRQIAVPGVILERPLWLARRTSDPHSPMIERLLTEIDDGLERIGEATVN